MLYSIIGLTSSSILSDIITISASTCTLFNTFPNTNFGTVGPHTHSNHRKTTLVISSSLSHLYYNTTSVPSAKPAIMATATSTVALTPSSPSEMSETFLFESTTISTTRWTTISKIVSPRMSTIISAPESAMKLASLQTTITRQTPYHPYFGRFKELQSMKIIYEKENYLGIIIQNHKLSVYVSAIPPTEQPETNLIA